MLNKFLKNTLLIAMSLVALSSTVQAHNHGASMKALKTVVESRTAEEQARDKYRHPAETLAFFKVEPGMTVAEALPGGGWYSKILAPYLGSKGTLYGVNYSDEMWPLFGFFSEERIAETIARTAKFPELVTGFTDNGIDSAGFTFASVPDSAKGKVDRVLFIRALHNLARFEDEAGMLTQALDATKMMLKPNGMVGVVQHRAPESASDDSVSGSRGYLKETALIKTMEEAGFELVAKSDINANPKDQPTDSEIVWRLPPSLSGAGDNAELKAKLEAIGESDRMTLLFKLAD